MVVVCIALLSLNMKRGTSIRVHSDDNVVVCCLIMDGSTRSIPLWSWILSIVQLLKSRGWFFNSGTCERDHQHSCRRSIQRSPDRDGIGFRYWQFSLDSQSRGETSGALICHQIEPQTASICISRFRRWSNRDRHPLNGLELLEDILSFSTSKDVTPYSSQTGVFHGIACVSSSLLTQLVLVSETSAHPFHSEVKG